MRFSFLYIVLGLAACQGDEPEVGTEESELSAAQCDYFAVNGKVRICHATGSTKNPYTVLQVSGSSCVTAHAAHPGDYVASNDPTCGGGGYLPPNAPCDSTLPCSSGYECRSGTCQPTDRCLGVSCQPDSACDYASCNPATGACVHEPTTGNGCDDGSLCTHNDTCQAGACTGGSATTCEALDQCHAAGTCDPATGACSNPAAPDGTACSDGDACTQTDTCHAGACSGANPVTCEASDQCHVAGTCDPATGACSNPTAPNGTACGDGDACTRVDSCLFGACLGGDPVTCVASDQCHGAGVCDRATGTCSDPALADGTACNDGDACTQSDTCQSGGCSGADPVTCVASDQCHAPGTCDPSTGACSNPTAADGTPCNDGNGCTQTDTCQGGACAGTNPVQCGFSDACQTAGACDPTTGACSAPQITQCTDDGDPCTADTCDPVDGCTHVDDPSCPFARTCFTQTFLSDDATQLASGLFDAYGNYTSPADWRADSCQLDPPQGSYLNGRYCPMIDQVIDQRDLSNVRIEASIYMGNGLATHPGIMFHATDTGNYGWLYLRPHNSDPHYTVVLSSAIGGFIGASVGGTHLEGLVYADDVGFGRTVDVVLEIVNNKLSLDINGTRRLTNFDLGGTTYAASGMSGVAVCDNNDAGMHFTRFKVTPVTPPTCPSKPGCEATSPGTVNPPICLGDLVAPANDAYSCVPAGTTATASSTYFTTSTSGPIDCVDGTTWNAGHAGNATYTINFPAPTAAAGIHAIIGAVPAALETYAVSGITSTGQTVTIPARQLSIPDGFQNPTHDPIVLGAADFMFDSVHDLTSITISITRGAPGDSSSWTAISAVELITPCPH